MAKQDIPFDRFYIDRCKNLVYRFGESGEHFDEMKKITLEDLQSLLREELDHIAIPWLYDWAKISGCTEFVEKVHNDRQARGLK